MKKLIGLLSALCLLFLLCACSGGSASAEPEPKEPETWLMIEGDDTVYEITYLHELSKANSLKADSYEGKQITFVAPLESVNGKTTLSFYKEVDSYLKFSVRGGWFYVETSGMEDTIIDFEPDDLIKVSGKITSMPTTGHLYMIDLEGWPSHPQNITVEKVSE